MKTERLFANSIISGCLGSSIVIFFLAYFSEQSFFLVLSTILGIVSISCFLLPLSIKLNLSITVLVVTLCLYIAEALVPAFIPDHMLRLPGDKAERADIALREGVDFDTRTLTEVVLDLRINDEKYWPSIVPGQLINTNGLSDHEKTYPLSGISQTQTVLSNESGKYIIYQSDQHGFNNPPGSWDKKIDAVLIGDSFTHGESVEQSETVSAYMTALGLETLNLGMRGSGPIIELAIFREYARSLTPKLVFLLSFEGNLENISRESTSQTLMNYFDPTFSQRLIEKQREIDRKLINHARNLLDRNKSYGHRSSVLSFILLERLRRLSNRVAQHVRSASKPFPLTEPPPLFRTTLEEIQTEVDEWGGDFYFVYLPSWNRYQSIQRLNHFETRYKNILKEVRTLGVSIIDFKKVVDGHDDPLSLFPFRYNGHFTSEGYRLLAKTIVSHLESRLPQLFQHSGSIVGGD